MNLKPETLRSTKLRKSAMGEECTLQIPGVCNGNPETTVLCHLDLLSRSGMGFKCSDISAAYGCSSCHDAMDKRTKAIYEVASERDLTPELAWLAYASYGILRTHIRMIEKGVLKV